jgi:CheY-like chemotaxis protein
MPTDLPEAPSIADRGWAGESRHVLLVDDEVQLLRLMEIELGVAGFEISVAADGNEALASIQSRLPDMVLLDLMMPYRDGWSVLEEIRRRTGRPSSLPARSASIPSGSEHSIWEPLGTWSSRSRSRSCST